MGLLAGGSRERFEVWQFYGLLYPPPEMEAMGKTLPWVIPGSRLLPTDRVAYLLSGSPPRRSHLSACMDQFIVCRLA
jgi:hypothetical protein